MGLWGDSPDGLVWALGCSAAQGATVLAANLDRRERAVNVVAPDARELVATLAPLSWAAVTAP